MRLATGGKPTRQQFSSCPLGVASAFGHYTRVVQIPRRPPGRDSFLLLPFFVPLASSAQVFRVLLLRRLWLPLPPTKRTCGCGRLLDSFGHHRAACANVGVAEASRWNPPQHVCAGKLAPAFQSTSSSGTWTSPPPTQATIGDWRWRRMASRCFMARSWPSTPRWFQRHAWLHRWGAMWAYSGARALALSLLERRGGHGADGPLPLNHDVLWEARYFV